VSNISTVSANLTDPRSRLPLPLYRCFGCGYLIPATDIVAEWERREASGDETKSLCACGSYRIAPGNLNPDEEEEHLSQARLARLLAGDTGPSTRVWRAALIEIRAGRVEATEDEKQAALAYLPNFTPFVAV